METTVARVLTRDDIASMDVTRACYDAIEREFAAVACGESTIFSRQIAESASGFPRIALMPAISIPRNVLGAKVQCTVMTSRMERNVAGLVVLHDCETGEIIGLLDAPTVTALRTAACSAVATSRLADRKSEVLAVIGSGAQARAHVSALVRSWPVREIRIWSPTHAHARRLSEDVARQFDVPVWTAASVSEVLHDAHIVCVATSSSQPVVRLADCPPRVHINSVGAYGAAARELESGIIGSAAVFVDDSEGARRECGDLILAVQEGAFAWESLCGDLGELVAGQKLGRCRGASVTVFKSIGVGVADLAAATAILECARASDIGKEIQL